MKDKVKDWGTIFLIQYFPFRSMVLANYLYKGVPVINQEMERGQK
jgi:hypothetical protein